MGPNSRKGSSRVHTIQGLRTYCTGTIHTVVLTFFFCFNFGEVTFSWIFVSRPSASTLCLTQQETRQRAWREERPPFPPSPGAAHEGVAHGAHHPFNKPPATAETGRGPTPPPRLGVVEPATRTRTRTRPLAARWGRVLAGGPARTDGTGGKRAWAAFEAPFGVREGTDCFGGCRGTSQFAGTERNALSLPPMSPTSRLAAKLELLV